jgi:hypothetical protein
MLRVYVRPTQVLEAMRNRLGRCSATSRETTTRTFSRYQVPRVNFDFQPVWPHDGKELFYIPGRMVAVNFTTTPAVAFGLYSRRL